MADIIEKLQAPLPDSLYSKKLEWIEEYLRASGWEGQGDAWLAPDAKEECGDAEMLSMRDLIARSSGRGHLHLYHAIMYQVHFDLTQARRVPAPRATRRK